MSERTHESSRRDFVKKAAYVAPVILSLKATSALAQRSSPYHRAKKDVEWDLKYWNKERELRFKKLVSDRNSERRKELKAAFDSAVTKIKELIEELKKFA